MAHFTKEYAAFFKELEVNNNKKWFEDNRSKYEKSVKEPFKSFVVELVKALQKLYPGINLDDKFSILRINRDIRFGADKTPYKIHMGAMILPLGKDDKSKPGFYVQANHQDIRVYSGAHQLEKDQLQSLRNHIKNNLKEFNKLISDKKFIEIFGTIHGEKNKRIPPEFREAAEAQPLISNTEFYYFFKLKPSELTKDDLVKNLIDNFKVALPLNRFLEAGLK